MKISQLLDQLFPYERESETPFRLVIPITVWGSLRNAGDGSVYVMWFLKKSEAEFDQDHLSVGWGERCIEAVETYIPSNIYNQACRNSLEANRG